ncbi:MAG: GNAT family N-acetyltransferase [Candidatus Bathyarchaeia archaeon]|nr:GNAT family N-acetyltransferase [Nitrososphaerota archaeon]
MSSHHYPNRRSPTKISRSHIPATIYIQDRSCSHCGVNFKGMTLGDVREHKGKHRAEIALGLASNIKTVQDVTGFSHGQIDAYFLAGVDGNVRGRLDYAVFKGNPYIQMIEVTPQFRRKGLARRMVEELAKEYGYENIRWGMLTEDGVKLKQKLDRDLGAS